MIKICSFSFEYSEVPVVHERCELQYVFDCRPLRNPGRIPEMQTKTGFDQEVVEYLEKEADVESFLRPIKALVGISLSEYLEKQDRYKNISFYFGCTGGRHRSVYCAEALFRYVREKLDHPTEVKHLRLEAIGESPRIYE